MKTITSKVQHKNFEPGEFVEEKVRTLQESLDLIKSFPWAEESTNNPIGITNPSITFKDESNNYLKLAPFYNRHFTLYFFNDKGQLFAQKGIELNSAINTIQHFFEDSYFDISTFKKEKPLFSNSKIHFYTAEFKYEIKGPFYFLHNFFYSSNIALHIMAFVCLGSLIFQSEIHKEKVLIYFIFYFILVCISRLYLYSSAKGKTLILSKGNDIFKYGDEKSLISYCKKDITEILIPGTKKGLGFENHFYRIYFEDGSYLPIPDLMIPTGKFIRKFPNNKVRYIQFQFS